MYEVSYLQGPGGGMDEELPQPLDMSWPETNRKRLTYILILPLILPLWITLPDTRKPESKKFFSITFLGSILWIAVFSYLMVWWATITGEAFSIPPEVSQNRTESYFSALQFQYVFPQFPEISSNQRSTYLYINLVFFSKAVGFCHL